VAPIVTIPPGLTGRWLFRGTQFAVVLCEDPSVNLGGGKHPLRSLQVSVLVPVRIKARRAGVFIVSQEFAVGETSVAIAGSLSMDDTQGWVYGLTPVRS
jgi:hypothetical protein